MGNKDEVKKVQLGFSNTTLPAAAGVDYNTYLVTLDPSDFLYFNDKAFSSLVGQKVNAADWGCEADAVMEVTQTGKGLAFISNEGTSSIFLIILIILGCIILAICIAIILLKVCKRKTENEDYQRSE